MSVQCLICLDDYDPDDQIRLLSCRHGFHKSCVDKWLQTGRNNCPACRSKVCLISSSMFLNFTSWNVILRACRPTTSQIPAQLRPCFENILAASLDICLSSIQVLFFVLSRIVTLFPRLAYYPSSHLHTLLPTSHVALVFSPQRLFS